MKLSSNIFIDVIKYPFRILLYTTLAVFFALFLIGSSTKAATYTMTACSSAQAITQLGMASSGDTVQAPATSGGTATWSAVVTVPSGVIFDGRGNCTITWATGGQLIVNTGTSGHTEPRNWTFLKGFTNGSCPILIHTNNSPMNSPFNFHNNTLTDDGSAMAPVTLICTDGLGSGVGHDNTITAGWGADELIHNLGGNAGNFAGWTDDITPGGPNMIYWEHNTFGNTIGGFVGNSAMENYYGARVVFRYNTLTDNQVDVHGSSPGCNNSGNTEINTRWVEVYNNQYVFTSGVNQSNTAQIRGGSGVHWGNTTSGTNAGGGYYTLTEDCTTGTWPMTTQMGRGYMGTNYSPAYYWNQGTGIVRDCENATFVQCGITPTDATNCTGHAGNVCDVVYTATQPATLERCESAADVSAGCPVSYTYTPYTYPYPIGTPQAAAPVCTPSTGAPPLSPTCSDSTPSSNMCWTVNGATPVTNGLGTGCSTGTNYTGAISITVSPSTLRIVGGASGFLDSTVSTYSYQILAPPAYAPTANFSKMYSPEPGNWQGMYGADGYALATSVESIPAYASYSVSNFATYVWNGNTSDPRALQSGSSRLAACWYAPTSFSFNVNLSDGRTHPVTLYALDFDQGGRVETINVTNATTGALLDTRTISAFTNGMYITWNCSGNVKFTVVRGSGVNAVISGIFFS